MSNKKGRDFNIMSLYYIQKYYDKFKGYCLERQKNNVQNVIGSPGIKIILFVVFAFVLGSKIDFNQSEKLFLNIVLILWISWFFFFMIRDFLTNACVDIMNRQPAVSPMFGKAVRDYTSSFDFIILHLSICLFSTAWILSLNSDLIMNAPNPLFWNIIMTICIVEFVTALTKLVFEYVRYSQFVQYKTIDNDKCDDTSKGQIIKTYGSINVYIILDNLWALSIELLLIVVIPVILIVTSIVDSDVELFVALMGVIVIEVIGFVMFKFTYDRLIANEPEIVFGIVTQKNLVNDPFKN